MGRKTEGNRKVFSSFWTSLARPSFVDEVSKSPTYLAASKPDHNAGGPDFAHRLRRVRLDHVNADAIFARRFAPGSPAHELFTIPWSKYTRSPRHEIAKPEMNRCVSLNRNRKYPCPVSNSGRCLRRNRTRGSTLVHHSEYPGTVR
jgi:hypothetical protein